MSKVSLWIWLLEIYFEFVSKFRMLIRTIVKRRRLERRKDEYFCLPRRHLNMSLRRRVVTPLRCIIWMWWSALFLLWYIRYVWRLNEIKWGTRFIVTPYSMRRQCIWTKKLANSSLSLSFLSLFFFSLSSLTPFSLSHTHNHTYTHTDCRVYAVKPNVRVRGPLSGSVKVEKRAEEEEGDSLSLSLSLPFSFTPTQIGLHEYGMILNRFFFHFSFIFLWFFFDVFRFKWSFNSLIIWWKDNSLCQSCQNF